MLEPPLPPPFHNEGLFSDHYLRHALPEEPTLWTTEGMETAREEIARVWAEQATRVERYNEAQLEEDLIQPVLRALGHVWQVQPTVGDHRPDYAFFAGSAERDAAEAAGPGERAYWDRAVAVGDAKAWGRRLDRRLTGGVGWDFQNPSFQIYHYLAETGCPWAILTNGRLWRLYAGRPRPDLQSYYEVDLPALLESGAPEDFAYFWLFFRLAAFVPDPQGKSPLDRVRDESAQAAEALRENVREGVYRALLTACRGFLSHGRNRLTDGDLQAIYDNSLVLLYRLLFALYAEAAGLLPVRDNPQYRDRYSLQSVRLHVADGREGEFLDRAVTLWPRLRTLFATIDAGHPGMGVPAYNGGLFDAEKHPYLEDNELADREVAELVRLLTLTPEGRTVDYRDLGVRHLGSIYEGLLEYRLVRARERMAVVRQKGRDAWVPAELAVREATESCDAGELYLATDKGERKASGSYYTPQFLVEHLIEHALRPVVDRCASAEEVLSLRVLDPAMGSGHFLVEATSYLARRLVEWGSDGIEGARGESETELAFLRRQVVERCIYGVDLNPLAVELAKLSLWLGTVAKGQPLSFLDHHLRCGNSLIGAWVADLPTPPPAKRRTQAKEPAQGSLFDEAAFSGHAGDLSLAVAQLGEQPSESREAVHRKAAQLEAVEREHRLPYREMANLWCSRHFGNEYSAAEYGAIVAHLQEPSIALPEAAGAKLERSRRLAAGYRFLHWELEFPEVYFDSRGRRRADAGFDTVLGNPPWERMKLQENEFFAVREPRVALAATAAQRKERIARLAEDRPELWAEYRAAKERSDLELAWMRGSGQFALTGTGDTNLYAAMAERARSLLAPRGRLGFVVPSGIATDSTTAAFFGDLVDRHSLRALLDFENREGAFVEVHRSFKFSLIVVAEGDPQEAFACGFFLRNAGDLRDPERVFRLGAQDCALMNPNTRTCPVFRTRRDADLTRAIYERLPVLVRETGGERANPWAVRYLRMFDMTNDSGLFRTAGELERAGHYPVAGNAWQKGSERYLPLYEGKMVQMYDHRAASVKVNPENVHRPSSPEPSSEEDYRNPDYAPRPQFWVPEAEVERRAGSGWCWTIAFKDVTSPTNERTMIAAAIPRVGAGNNLPLLFCDGRPGRETCCLLANLCSLPLDYVARQKVGGQHLNYFIVEQLPVIPPERYADEFGGVVLGDFVRERVLELTYTAHDMAGFARDMGYVGEDGQVRPPFAWDEERRLHLRCQLDALYFHLYGLSRDEAEHVLETFPIVRRRDEQAYGRYRSRDLVLHYWSAYEAGDMGITVRG